MIVIFFLIPLSIVIAACFLGAFIWAVRSGQYEDTCTPSLRVLMEEEHSHRQNQTTDRTELDATGSSSSSSSSSSKPAEYFEDEDENDDEDESLRSRGESADRSFQSKSNPQ